MAKASSNAVLLQLVKAVSRSTHSPTHCHSLQVCRSISTTAPRDRRVFWTTRPLPRGTERRILNAVTAPIYPEKPVEKKKKSEQSEIQEAYNAFKLREAQELLTQNQMVAICHRLPTTNRDFLHLRAKVFLGGLQLKFIRNDLAIKATENTRLQNLKPYFNSSTAFLISEEPKIPELIKLLKKCPELQLLGGLVENRIMSRDELLNAAKLPSLDVVRGQLVSLLNSSASNTSRMLAHHQGALSANLTQLVKQAGEGNGDGGDASAT